MKSKYLKMRLISLFLWIGLTPPFLALAKLFLPAPLHLLVYFGLIWLFVIFFMYRSSRQHG